MGGPGTCIFDRHRRTFDIQVSADINAHRLRQMLSNFPYAKGSLHQLDSADLSKVGEPSHAISADVLANKIPRLSAIVCNAQR